MDKSHDLDTNIEFKRFLKSLYKIDLMSLHHDMKISIIKDLNSFSFRRKIRSKTYKVYKSIQLKLSKYAVLTNYLDVSTKIDIIDCLDQVKDKDLIIHILKYSGKKTKFYLLRHLLRQNLSIDLCRLCLEYLNGNSTQTKIIADKVLADNIQLLLKMNSSILNSSSLKLINEHLFSLNSDNNINLKLSILPFIKDLSYLKKQIRLARSKFGNISTDSLTNPSSPEEDLVAGLIMNAGLSDLTSNSNDGLDFETVIHNLKKKFRN